MPDTDSVISSLDYCIDKISKNSSVLVNLVTSIPTSYAKINDFQFADQLTRSNQWSGYTENEGQIQIVLKHTFNQTPFYAFTGIFHLPYSALYSLLKKENITKSDLFSILTGEELNKYTFSKGNWLDCGHEVNYYETKAKLISSRSFNKITFVDRGITTKRSSNAAKLSAEANYYTILPSDISIFFPRLVEKFCKEEKGGAYQLEFYGYPNIVELIMYWDLSNEFIQRMFEHLNLVLKKFKKYTTKISKDDFINFYQVKLYSRVNEYISSIDHEDTLLLENEIVINGQVCKPFSFFETFINDMIESLYNEDDFCIMHGDFCYK